MALSPDHTQLIHANYQLQSTSTLYKQRTHRPKCISSRDGVHGTEQLQKISLARIITISARESSPFCANHPVRIVR